ncbi:RAMP superfamily CRISPR-associated protein [Saccharolobus islandicus]|uniref:CRISPR type III-associated protein domain-containing protein n=2 Tax=Saccharolobus islandicus TaxID=43080 RepID=C3MWL5_SACI4|nr:RAMP superfamily CRISPR-associated protein [Sulfolobus islandicus]ACP37673.1 protein of unknown function DUF324 [Sulfolobus islandicus M.14.25]ACP54868.1 protein of unknown function DUF324 [Sulfolobus islandicus M.16.27]
MIAIKVSMKNLASLTIAGGSTISSIDIPLNPLGIPPSSIKGAMRTAVHNLLPKGYTSCGEVEPESIKKAHEKGICDVCKLFGYPDSLTSCFTIEVSHADYRISYLTRVSIDDKTQKVKEGSLFTQEVILPNNNISFTIYYTCNDERLFKLLLYSILDLRYWRLGRNTMVDVKVNNVEDICKGIKCDDEIKGILNQLSSYLWGENK